MKVDGKPNPDGMKNFCAAPWVEAVLYFSGHLRTCCRNGTVFGNWQTHELVECWHSETYQNFRSTIHNGEFPDVACEKCYNNGTARSLSQEVGGPYYIFSGKVFDFLGKQPREITSIVKLFKLRSADEGALRIIERYKSFLETTIKESANKPGATEEILTALYKLTVIGGIVGTYLTGDLKPPHVAPFRQVQLIAKCNARCIQCPGRYSKEIIEGGSLDERFIDKAFSNARDIIDFYMNGSEFLFYEGYKKISKYLTSNGIKLSISSNGILLTPSNIRFLIDNKVVKTLNISMDGATKETVEAIRVNVNYDKLVESISYICQYATEKSYDFTLSISFVLMKRNFREFPALVRLIHRLRKNYAKPSLLGLIRRLRKNYEKPRLYIYCQALENYSFHGYVDFVKSEHHSLIDDNELRRVFDDALAASKETGIKVSAFYSTPIEEFVKQGYPFPKLTICQPEYPSNTSPTLEIQEPLDPNSSIIYVKEGEVAFSPCLIVPDTYKGKEVTLYAGIVRENAVYVASMNSGEELDWNPHESGSIKAFRHLSLGNKVCYNLGRHHFGPSKTIDVYIGFSDDAYLTDPRDLIGAAYKVISI